MPIFKTGVIVFAILPWVADFLSENWVMKTLGGSFLWAVSLLFFILSSQTSGHTQKKCQQFALSGLFLWFSYFVYHLLFSKALIPNSSYSIWSLHGVFLGSSFGCMALCFASLILGRLKNEALRKGSARKFKKLPSLEFFLKSQGILIRWSFSFWTIGMLLAVANVLSESLSSGNSNIIAWILDYKTLFSLGMWLMLWQSLSSALQLKFASEDRYWKKQLLFSTVWILAFLLLTTAPLSQKHEALRWFVR